VELRFVVDTHGRDPMGTTRAKLFYVGLALPTRQGYCV